MHFWHTLHRHMHYAFMADTYQSWLSLAGSACLSEIFSTPTISGPSSSQLLEKYNIWMFTIFLDMLIWNKVTSLVDVLYQNYHTLTQRFCRQGTDIQFVFPKNSPPWVWGTAEDVEVGSKGFPLLQCVGQVLEQSLRQEESSLKWFNRRYSSRCKKNSKSSQKERTYNATEAGEGAHNQERDDLVDSTLDSFDGCSTITNIKLNNVGSFFQINGQMLSRLPSTLLPFSPDCWCKGRQEGQDRQQKMRSPLPESSNSLPFLEKCKMWNQNLPETEQPSASILLHRRRWPQSWNEGFKSYQKSLMSKRIFDV